MNPTSMPNHATSLPKPSALPESWVARIFEHMAGLYGSKFADLWGGSSPEKVHAVWAEKLAGFADKPHAIKAALDALDEHPFPPTLPEFVVLCRNAARRVGSAQAALPHKPTTEERQRQAEMARRIGDAVGADKIRDGIDEHWATHPRSPGHLRLIFDAAKRDPRISKCIEQMVSDGICTANGKLLRSYQSGTWQATA